MDSMGWIVVEQFKPSSVTEPRLGSASILRYELDVKQVQLLVLLLWLRCRIKRLRDNSLN